MRSPWLLVPILLTACTTPRSEPAPTHAPPAAASQALTCAAETGLAVDEVTRRGALVLGRTAFSPNGQHHPTARFVLRTGTGPRALDLGDALAGALLTDGALLVRPDETLVRFDVRGCERLVARDVLPDLAVSDDGQIFAFVVRAGDGTAIELGGEGPNTRAIVSAFAEADRPLFLDARTLLFVGAPTPGPARFHTIGLAGGVPRALAVTELPASREGYRVDGTVVRFHDGERLRALDVQAEVVR